MNPLALAYGAATYCRNRLYDSGWFSAHLQGPVISVGSISAGGAGKTPFVILLGELLKAREIAFDVLSRGYARKSKGVRLVDLKGDPQSFGDEPLLIARRLGEPLVVVGENRYHAGLFAEQKFGARLHLLDDGFQHRALARDLDLVLLTESDTQDVLLPAGRLREPFTSLSRADVIVLIDGAALPRVELKKAARIWRVCRRSTIQAVPTRPLAFCGIARPQNFFSDLRAKGISAVAEQAFRDHYRYDEHDVDHLLKLGNEKGANGFVTTEKDAINLGTRAALLQPLALAKVEMELEDAERCISEMLKRISLAEAELRRERI